jgi:hypothetical protein
MPKGQIEEWQTMQWPNVKGQKDKQISPDILGFSTGGDFHQIFWVSPHVGDFHQIFWVSPQVDDFHQIFWVSPQVGDFHQILWVSPQVGDFHQIF